MKNTILLNNLFSGSYNINNLGGEIINIYKTDNDKFYVYVNPNGKIPKNKINKIEYVLFIRSVGNKTVKVIGKAKIKKSINFSITKNDKADEKKLKIDNFLNEYDIKYGGKLLNKINEYPSSQPITYEAEYIKLSKKDIYLIPNNVNINNENKNVYKIKSAKKINNQSQRLYIQKDESEDYDKLMEIINNDNLWKDIESVKLNNDDKNSRKDYLLSIINKEYDELVMSNLLAYYLDNNKEFWKEFAKNILEIEVNEKPRIIREFKNIDIFISVEKYIIVIENKIKSNIILYDTGKTQLDKYVDVVNKYVKDNYLEYDKTCKIFYLLRPNYNNFKFNNNKYKEIKYSEILKILDKLNKKNNDYIFNEFYNAVKIHSKEYNNTLFEKMNREFIKRIKKGELSKRN